MLSGGETVIVGLSGGADSVALLCALDELKDRFGISLHAVHVDHGIRGETASRDRIYCEKLCEKMGIGISVFREDIPRLAAEKGIGLEQCGRERRYELFAQAASLFDNAKIATAHTLSDSCETVLFNIARGCGSGGLVGIPAVRGNIIRPLITSLRSDTEAYCSEHGIEYMTDETNSDTAYTRNLIRIGIIPAFLRINPDFAGSVQRLSALVSDEHSYIERQADALYRRARTDGGLDAALLAEADIALVRRAVIRLISEITGITPQYRHVGLVCDMIFSKTSGAVELNKQNTVRVSPGTVGIVLTSSENGKKAGFNAVLSTGNIPLADGRTAVITVCGRNIYDDNMNISLWQYKNALDYDIIKIDFEKDGLLLRNRHDGDRIALAGRHCTHKVKKLLCDAHILPEKRDNMMLIERAGGIIWLEGFGAAEGFQVKKDTKNVIYIDIE